MSIKLRRYGETGPPVVLVHGGPGAPGYLAPVARELARSFRVLEPIQRRSGTEPLTVDRHVEDLGRLVRTTCGDARPALVGHSWGAMLALAFAAAHPGRASSLVLVGCGTFDRLSRLELNETLGRRTGELMRRRLELIDEETLDPDERLRLRGIHSLPLYSHRLVELDGKDPLELETCDARGYRESWNDMTRLQDEGVYPAAFATIDVPVLMLHGTDDPHPGPRIRASLAPHLPQLEYRELERCGHYPWLEAHARDEFFALLTRCLARYGSSSLHY